MFSILKQLLPVTAAFGLVLGIAATASRAEEGKDAPAAGKGSITGTVTDKDGKAVEGVKVNLMKPRQKQGGGGSGGAAPAAPKATHGHHDAIGLQQQRPQPIATATTDKDGKYELKDVDAGDYGVIVRDDEKKVYGRAKVKVEDGKAATADIKCTDTPPQRGGGGGGGGNGGGGGGNAK
jgi:hypothetical protein